MTRKYDVIVVGAGLIGSAAARHLVEISKDVKVLLIGPEELKVMLMHSPPEKKYSLSLIAHDIVVIFLKLKLGL